MSQYSKYYNNKTQEAPVAPEVKEEVIDTVTEEPVVTPEVTEEPVTEEPTVEEDDTIIGVVTECVKLNVRKEPVADAEILTTILLGAEVQVDIFESTEDFYKVTTGAGIEGYCVKDYINID